MISLFTTWNGVRSKAAFHDHSLILLWSSCCLTFITVLGFTTFSIYIGFIFLFSQLKYSDGTEDKDEDSKGAVEGNVSSSIYFCSCPVHAPLIILLILCLCSLQNKMTTLLSLFIIMNVSQVSECILRLMPYIILLMHWNVQPLGSASYWCSYELINIR